MNKDAYLLPLCKRFFVIQAGRQAIAPDTLNNRSTVHRWFLVADRS